MLQNPTANPINSIVWKQNTLYDGNYSLSHSDTKYNLPDWLSDRKEMIFLQKYVVKGKLLGKGQFGNVYKGKLHQGSAV